MIDITRAKELLSVYTDAEILPPLEPFTDDSEIIARQDEVIRQLGREIGTHREAVHMVVLALRERRQAQ